LVIITLGGCFFPYFLPGIRLPLWSAARRLRPATIHTPVQDKGKRKEISREKAVSKKRALQLVLQYPPVFLYQFSIKQSWT
jgi:hypothetical protein